jgi:hypothetical protein
VSRLRTNRKSTRLRPAGAGLVLIAACVSLSACSDSPETASYYEPARLEPIEGTEIKRVKFSAEGAKRVGLQTAAVRRNAQGRVIPYAAVIYDSRGNTYAYTSPERLTFVRQDIEIDRVDGDLVVLSEGPPAGTKVVTVGAAEVYGTEFEVAH